MSRAMDEFGALSGFCTAAMRFVRDHPDRLTPELEAAYGRYREVITTPYVVRHATCKKCGHPLVVRDCDEPKWVHDTLQRERGCRAASYSRLAEGWDDTLERSWVATPDKRTITEETVTPQWPA